MRWLINYIRECFCSHDLVISEKYCESTGGLSDKSGVKVSAHCKKCGYVKSKWKYL